MTGLLVLSDCVLAISKRQSANLPASCISNCLRSADRSRTACSWRAWRSRRASCSRDCLSTVASVLLDLRSYAPLTRIATVEKALATTAPTAADTATNEEVCVVSPATIFCHCLLRFSIADDERRSLRPRHLTRWADSVDFNLEDMLQAPGVPRLIRNPKRMAVSLQ